MLIHSAYQTNVFDVEESIKLSVEIYNPRFAAYQSYKNTLGADQQEPEFTPLTLGNEKDPWFDNLMLYTLSNGKETNNSLRRSRARRKAKETVCNDESSQGSVYEGSNKPCTQEA